MNKLVITDDLTNSYNRRYINERLPMDVIKSIENNIDLSIVIIDIDYFKSVNDNYGHSVGDFILKKFTEVIKNNIRSEYDWLARYGGEEFIIVFNNTSKEKALEFSEVIRKVLNNTEFITDDIKIKVTASFGVATLSKEDCNLERILQTADKNLYIAKNEGRNLIVG